MKVLNDILVVLVNTLRRDFQFIFTAKNVLTLLILRSMLWFSIEFHELGCRDGLSQAAR